MFYVNGRCEGVRPRTFRKDLEAELQAELHDPGAAGTEQRIAVSNIRSRATAAECGGRRGVAAQIRTSRRPVGIADDGVIEQVEDFESELGSPPLRELEVLEEGEVPVLEALIPEQIPAHVAEVAGCRRSHDRAAVDEAAK